MPLHGEFVWQHHDLCLFHQAIYSQLASRHDDLAVFEDEHRQLLDADVTGEAEAVYQSRVRTIAHVHQLEMDSMERNGDHLLIVGLWTMIEQYCSRTLRVAENIASGASVVPASYKWHDLKQRFLALNIDLTSCENFEGAEECRVLNNKIKHLGTVDAQLAQFPRFSGAEGKLIHAIALEMQTYSNAAYEFIGSMMESTADAIA